MTSRILQQQFRTFMRLWNITDSAEPQKWIISQRCFRTIFKYTLNDFTKSLYNLRSQFSAIHIKEIQTINKSRHTIRATNQSWRSPSVSRRTAPMERRRLQRRRRPRVDNINQRPLNTNINRSSNRCRQRPPRPPPRRHPWLRSRGMNWWRPSMMRCACWHRIRLPVSDLII